MRQERPHTHYQYMQRSMVRIILTTTFVAQEQYPTIALYNYTSHGGAVSKAWRM